MMTLAAPRRALLNILGFILRHPLNQNARFAALIRFVRWQLTSRLALGPIAMPFVANTRLLVRRGMTGATGNIYCGLHEFEDMAFVMHVLQPNDLFVDIGANIGAYTVLAAGVCRARAIAFEPVPRTFAYLQDNLHLNSLDGLATARNIALGAEQGFLRLTEFEDTTNHVLSAFEANSTKGIDVKQMTLDTALDGLQPTLIKIDVEGFETPVLSGGQTTLAAPSLIAVLLELNGSGHRYGFDERALHQKVLDHGFAPFRYEPFTRVLKPLQRKNMLTGNTLYIRNIDEIARRVSAAPRRMILNNEV